MPTELLVELSKYNWLMVILALLTLMGFVVALATLIGKFSEIIGKPVSWIKKNNADHELLVQTANALVELKNQRDTDVAQSISHDKEIREHLDEFIKEQREDMSSVKKLVTDLAIHSERWKVMDVGSGIANGRKYSIEQIVEAMNAYDRYEVILEKNGLTNGQADASYKIIEEEYGRMKRAGM